MSKKRGEKLKEISNLNVDYILCFRSYFILPEKLLKKPRFCSINFHPAPPSYPGSGGVNFALYNNEKTFGITIHRMNEMIDNGEIIKIKNFKIDFKDNLDGLLKKTHVLLLKSFIELTNKLKENGQKYIEEMIRKNKNINWSKKKIKISELENFQVIDPDISKIELQKRIRAFHTDLYPLQVNVHGKKFIMKK